MRKLMVITASLGFSISAWGQTPKSGASNGKTGGSVEHALSFYQWMDLSPKARADYIKGLGEILVDRERSERKLGVEVAEIRAQQERAAVLKLLLGDAANARSQQQPPEQPPMSVWEAEFGPVGMPEEPARVAPREVVPPPANQERPVRVIEPPRREEPTDVERAREEPPVAERRTPPPRDPSCQSQGPACAMQVDMDTSRTLQDYRAPYQEAMRALPANERRCVIGGFISRLNSRMKCTPVTSWTIGSGWRGSCPSGQTMCNPLVFGFKEDQKPFCVPLAQMVTTECGSQSARAGNTHERVAEQLMGRTPQTRDLNIDDLADRWREFRRDMAGLCAPGASLEFHCSECSAMHSKMQFMNMASTCADQCGRVPASIDEAACRRQYHQRRGGSGDRPDPNSGAR